MRSAAIPAELRLVESSLPPPARGVIVARYAGIDAQRRPTVWDTEGADAAPRVARCLTGLTGPVGVPSLPADAPLGTPVLVLAGQPGEAPIILGVIADSLPAPAPLEAAPSAILADLHPGQVSSATADGQRLVFEAGRELVLKCGKGSITLHASGRVVIKGTELVSRAQGANKIRGATVSIN